MEETISSRLLNASGTSVVLDVKSSSNAKGITYFKRPCTRGLRQPFFCLQVDSDIRLYLASTSTSKTRLGLILKAIFSKGGQRSEVRDGPFHNYHLPSQRLTLRIKARRTSEVARSRSNVRVTIDVNRAQLHVRIKAARASL